MTEVQPLVFPASRVLVGWSKLLAPCQPQRLWVGYLFLHRVEALVELTEPAPLDPLAWFVLKGLQVAGTATREVLDERLQLGPLLRQVLRWLEGHALIEADTSGSWSLTSNGRLALETSIYARSLARRRFFYFREIEQPGLPAQWLDFKMPRAASDWQPAGPWHFDIQLLEKCLERAESWKEQRGFPKEVRRILGLSVSPAALPEWQRVPLDHPERLAAALVLTQSPEGKDRLLGFAAQPEGWVLSSSEPAFVLGEDWQETFPELAAEPDPVGWAQAWLNWCQPRGLPVAEIEACQLNLDGMRMSIRAPDRLLERFRATRSDVLRGEAWLLLGGRNLRRAVRAEISDAR
jgi:hypothetical protein